MKYVLKDKRSPNVDYIPTPIEPSDPTNKQYVDTMISTKLDINGKAVDSDKLDGLDSSQFVRSDLSQTLNVDYYFLGNNVLKDSYTYRVPKIKNGSISYDTNPTGYIVIKMPFTWNNAFINFTVDITQIVSSGPSYIKLSIAGLASSSTNSWTSTSASLISNSDVSLYVRFGRDGSTCCVYIGDSTTNWYSPKIQVTDIGGSCVGNNSIAGALTGPWNVTVGTTISTVTSTIYATSTASSSLKLSTARNINGTAFDGTADITTATWGAARTITLGSTGKSVDGGANVAWTVTELVGYTPVNKAGDTMTGILTLASDPVGNLDATTKQYVDSIFKLQPGNIILGQVDASYPGLLICNGAMVSKTTYSSLYSAIGDSYYYSVIPGGGTPFKTQYGINTTTSSPGSWTSSTNIPAARSSGVCLVTTNYVHLMGGMSASNTYVSTVYRAPINANGTLGGWSTQTALPANIANSKTVMYKNKAYLVGGQTASSTYVAAVYSATINSDGTLGPWSNVSTIPTTVSNHGCIITKNKMYVIGGKNASQLNTVYCTTVNSDGSLGAWYNSQILPLAYSCFEAVVIKDYVYLLGGNNGTRWYNIVYRAPILSDGSIGTFTFDSYLPVAISDFQTVLTNNNIFLLGGKTAASSYVSTVYSAPINADGSIGSWTALTAIPDTVCDHLCFVTNGYLYIAGGNNASYLATVYRTPFSGGLNDYSPYYDGTVETNNSSDFRLPDLTATQTDPLLNYYIKY